MLHPSGKELAKKTLLVVEDNPARGALLFQILSEQAGYRIIMVPTGSQAMLLIKGDSKLRPDLVLLSDNLLDMNGLEFYNCLSGRTELAIMPPMLIPFADSQGFLWFIPVDVGHQPPTAQEL